MIKCGSFHWASWASSLTDAFGGDVQKLNRRMHSTFKGEFCCSFSINILFERTDLVKLLNNNKKNTDGISSMKLRPISNTKALSYTECGDIL